MRTFRTKRETTPQGFHGEVLSDHIACNRKADQQVNQPRSLPAMRVARVRSQGSRLSFAVSPGWVGVAASAGAGGASPNRSSPQPVPCPQLAFLCPAGILASSRSLQTACCAADGSPSGSSLARLGQPGNGVAQGRDFQRPGQVAISAVTSPPVTCSRAAGGHLPSTRL